MNDEATLGGYLRQHERPPSFGGSDGCAYSVGILVDGVAERGFGAALLFVRWSTSGDRPVGHLETDYLVFGRSEREAKRAVLELTLFEVKDQLERTIEHAANRTVAEELG
jgi:hypothetical protein